MPQIEVSEEDYQFLKDCINELKTQDNRCTRNPVYTVWHKKRIYGLASDYAEDYGFVWDDNFLSPEEVIESAIEGGYIEEDTLENIFTENDTGYLGDCITEKRDLYTFENLKKGFLELEYYDQESLLQEFVDKDIYIGWYRDEDVQVENGGCFSFFEKDAFDHIKMNKHNISGECHTYADSLFRTPRMEKLLDLLNKLELK